MNKLAYAKGRSDAVQRYKLSMAPLPPDLAAMLGSQLAELAQKLTMAAPAAPSMDPAMAAAAPAPKQDYTGKDKPGPASKGEKTEDEKKPAAKADGEKSEKKDAPPKKEKSEKKDECEPKKEARIFGAEEPEGLEHAAIPYEHRRQSFTDYLGAKSKEKPTSYGKAMGVGGLIGAVPGALTGLIGGNDPKEKLLHALIGGTATGLLGAGTGALMAAGDRAAISNAKGLMADPSRIDPELSEIISGRIQSHHDQRAEEEERRHQELLEELRNRGSAGARPNFRY